MLERIACFLGQQSSSSGQVKLTGKLFNVLHFLWCRNARHRTTGHTNGASRNRLGHSLGLEWIGHPRCVKGKGTFGHSLVPITIGIDARVATMREFEELILTLVMGPGVTNARDTQLGYCEVSQAKEVHILTWKGKRW